MNLNTQWAKKHLKECLIGKHKLKPEWLKLERPATPTADKDMEQPELWCTGGWSVNCYPHENKYEKVTLEGFKNEQSNQKGKLLRIR